MCRPEEDIHLLGCSLWGENALEECHFDDTLWGYAIRMSEETLNKNVKQCNIVLHHLFNIRIYDWADLNIWGPEGIWLMWYSAIMGHRLFKMIMDEGKKVYLHLTDFFLILLMQCFPHKGMILNEWWTNSLPRLQEELALLITSNIVFLWWKCWTEVW